ncbi:MULTISPECIES: 1-(5-phosphoribosyl)-5-[(5-phosphoribosylamino)methylideneamino]imidazole-4-carboxamide isomerase [Exiguobacterium]|uniref:1-(5-phosphoribosyl)-5-[(5-phosphoribosylamino)methylideneamino] imidazole-4-carboxamide isomerase n=1 Tax=Exiguobacterium aurantiacum TaxID=33987 RepID=A0A377FU37_9BACL|nr:MULTISPECIES: 1-(5-phosphoribosyl)-5-[(5-phosphoribosylamino)methylideneamino]imidazole-4-carboxamide isomerase [Exiguobacterium]STO08321.1 1-(5-phosphoribosyl)-5-[(5-phosphoribosylamino)methylideneamino] imidazole-4-carboxamide isomerase [Exiguobacterium aurantiacum]
MRLLPAIDLIDGKIVRLTEGDFNTEEQYGDPYEKLKEWQGRVPMLHLIDLEGAKAGEPRHLDVVRFAKECGFFVQTGGGIRSVEALDAVMETGADRVLLGTKAFTDPDFLDAALAKYGDRIAVALDAYDGMVAVNGWQEATTLRDIEAANDLVARGVKTILYTDIGSDGKLNGPNLERMRALREAVTVTLIASGGVTTEADVQALSDAQIDEAVVGKALLSGKVSLDQLIEWEARHA